MTPIPEPSTQGPRACRNCEQPATVAIRSGFESHPTCDECAAWWPEHRKEPLSEVADDYEYEAKQCH